MNKEKIMIVEDEMIAAIDLQQAIRRWGYETCELQTSGAEAVRTAERESPDIVLMDMCLPGDVDGIEAARMMHLDLGIPVIFITGYSDDDIREKANIAGPSGYFVKPVILDKLKETIRSVLDKKINK